MDPRKLRLGFLLATGAIALAFVLPIAPDALPLMARPYLKEIAGAAGLLFLLAAWFADNRATAAGLAGALLAATGRSGTYNIATGVAADVMSIWRGLCTAAGVEIEPQLEDLRPGELQDSCLDPSLAERELGWHAQVPLEEGLPRTYEALASSAAAR